MLTKEKKEKISNEILNHPIMLFLLKNIPPNINKEDVINQLSEMTDQRLTSEDEEIITKEEFKEIIKFTMDQIEF